MVRALLFCSDDECTDLFEAIGPLPAIEALACECGCGLAVIGFPEPVPDRTESLTLALVA